MPWFHPKTWDDGVMPLAEFPVEEQERIARAVADHRPPKRWISVGFGQIESRAWYEWHWARGKKLKRRPGNRRARPPIPQAIREAVYQRDGYRCLHCGAEDRLSLDHIYPWSLGGGDTPDNLQTLCRPCNSRKGARV